MQIIENPRVFKSFLLGSTSDAATAPLWPSNTQIVLAGAVQYKDFGAVAPAYPGYFAGLNGRYYQYNLPEAHIDFFGADPTGVADSTDAIKDARDYLVGKFGRGAIVFGNGDYLITDVIEIENDNICIRGQGNRASIVNFVPTADNTVFRFQKSPAAVIYNNTIRDIGFHSTDSTYAKTAIEGVDFSSLTIESVWCNNWRGGTGCIFFHSQGREKGVFKDWFVATDTPVKFSGNPNHSSIDADSFTFDVMYFTNTEASNTRAAFDCDSDVNIYNLSASNVSAVGFKYGFYSAHSSGNFQSNMLEFNNWRCEQSTDSTGYCFYFNYTTGGVQHISFNECEMDGPDTGVTGRNGVFAVGVTNMVFKNCNYSGTSGTNINATAANNAFRINITSCIWRQGSSPSLTNYLLREGNGLVTTNTLLENGVYGYNNGNTDAGINSAIIRRSFGDGNVRTLDAEFTIANGNTYTIPPSINSGADLVLCTVAALGSTIYGGMTAMTGSLGSKVVSRSDAAFDVGNVASALCLFKEGNTLKFLNNTAESLRCVVTLKFIT